MDQAAARKSPNKTRFLAIINKPSNLSQYSDMYFSKEVRDLWHMADIKKFLKRLPLIIGFVTDHHMALGNSLMPKASLQEHLTLLVNSGEEYYYAVV